MQGLLGKHELGRLGCKNGGLGILVSAYFSYSGAGQQDVCEGVRMGGSGVWCGNLLIRGGVVQEGFEGVEGV